MHKVVSRHGLKSCVTMLKIKMSIIASANYISSNKTYQSIANHVMSNKLINMTISLWIDCLYKYLTTIHAGYIATHTHTLHVRYPSIACMALHALKGISMTTFCCDFKIRPCILGQTKKHPIPAIFRITLSMHMYTYFAT